jgi:hypothetical protein
MLPVLLLLLLSIAEGHSVPARGGATDCGEWRDCRQRALDAAAAHDYETFHDLAWRAVQKGPPQDASLMQLLARAQSLSGRPHDALVMLLRLADRGIVTDAADSDEFAAVRRLPQWPEAEARLRGTPGAPESTAVATAPVTPAAPDARRPDAGLAPRTKEGSTPTGAPPGTRPDTPPLDGAAAPAAMAPATAAVISPARGTRIVEDALRVPSLAITPVALAHDRASGRFVFGDAAGRKLVIVDERMHFVVDLVREQSAGFYDITAFEIDPRRGDLWVVSADAAGATALHHVQMVSGRPLARLEMPDGLGSGRFVDVAVTSDGTVYVLDAAGPRLFSLRQKQGALTVAARLELRAPSSIAPAGDGIVYVAHEGGVSRVDTQTGRVLPVRTRTGSLPAFARIRWDGGGLLGVERLDDGTCRILRVRIDPLTAAARAPQVLASGMAIPAPSAMTVSDDALYYVSRDENPAGTAATDTIVKRLSLR